MTVPTALQTETSQVLNIFQRIANKDRTVFKDCVNTYGNVIWELAKKAANSTEEAEAATREIFIDIWRYAERGSQSRSAESVLIALIARRRLAKFLS